MLSPLYKYFQHVVFFPLTFCCIRTCWCSYCTDHMARGKKRWLQRLRVNSSSLTDLYEYNVQQGQIGSLQKHTAENQLRLQCPAGDLSGFLKTLKHSQSILRFMLHLCRILVVVWLIKWLLRESSLFTVCMAACLLDWPALQVQTYFLEKLPSCPSLSFILHCLVWQLRCIYCYWGGLKNVHFSESVI